MTVLAIMSLVDRERRLGTISEQFLGLTVEVHIGVSSWREVDVFRRDECLFPTN